MSYSIVVDGGGTRTRLALAKDKAIVYTLEQESAKPTVVGFERSAALLFQGMQTLCSKAGVAFNHVKNIVIGMAGIWKDEERKALYDELFRVANTQWFILPHTVVCSDAEIAYRGAFAQEAQGKGILLIAGTGSIALTEDEHGNLQRAGGYGLLLGDEGSGAWIGRAGLQLVLRQLNGRFEYSSQSGNQSGHKSSNQLSNLTKKILALHPEPEPTPRALASFYAQSPTALASLAPLIFEGAVKNKKDDTCNAILETAADELLLLATSLLKYHNHTPVPLVLSGGIATHPQMKKLLTSRLEFENELKLTKAKGAAIEGALAMIDNRDAVG